MPKPRRGDGGNYYKSQVTSHKFQVSSFKSAAVPEDSGMIHNAAVFRELLSDQSDGSDTAEDKA